MSAAAPAVSQDDLNALGARIQRLDRDRFEQWVADLTPHERQVAAQAIERAAWRRDLSSFAAHLDKNYRRWRYHRFLGEKFRQAVTGESTRQLWMLPFRYGKTLDASIWGPAWALDQDPTLKVILTSYGHSLAAKNSSMVKDILEAHADQLTVRVRRGRAAVGRWETEQGGEVMATGVGGAMTGWGGDLIVVDDPFRNWQDAASQLKRDTVWDWYRAVVYTRLQTEHSSLLVVGTRWHEDDLSGRLLQPPDGEPPEPWDIVRMPAIAEEPEKGIRDWERVPDLLGRKPGEVLEPERFPPETVQLQKRTLGPYLFGSMMQQRPAAAEGQIIKRTWWKWYTTRPVMPDDWVTSWDASFADAEGSSFCVGTVWCRVGGNKYLMDLVRDRMDFPSFMRAVSSLAAKWPECRRILIEDKANGPAVLSTLRGHVSGMVARTPKGSKESRVHAVSGDIEGGNVFLPDPVVNEIDRRVDRSFVADFVSELAGFPTATNDDQVDSTTMALLEWNNAAFEMPEELQTYTWNAPNRR